MKRGRSLLALCLVILTLCITGCKTKESRIEKLREIEFTVVKESEIPVELLKMIDERKQEPLKFTYATQNKDFLYIVVGYGKQVTGGYSIALNDLYLTKNAIYIDTDLVGPSKDDVVTQAMTYPYIVIKTEYMDKPVAFT